MNHKEAIRGMLERALKRAGIDWYIQADRAFEILSHTTGETYDSLSEKIDIGLANGHSVEYQISLMESLFTNFFKELDQ